MTVVPRYDLPKGTQLATLVGEKTVSGTDEYGYHLVDNMTGAAEFITYENFIEREKLSGGMFSIKMAVDFDRFRQRLGGYASSKALPKQQQEYGKFHLALCHGMKALREHLRKTRRVPTLSLSIRTLDDPTNRVFVQRVAQEHFAKKIHVQKGRGGNTTSWIMYRGRTLIKYFNVFDGLQPGENPLDALVTLGSGPIDWLDAAAPA